MRIRTLLLMGGLLTSPLLHAESYSLLIYETPGALAERDQPAKAEAYWSAYDRYAGALVKAGVLRGGTALELAVPASEAGRHQEKVAAPSLGGYFVIEVASLAEAERWAAQAPALAARVEVRPHRANPHMAAP